MTHNLSEGKTHEPRPYLRGSVRRASGFVLTGNSHLAVAALLPSLIGGTEATGHEAEAKFQKKTQ